MSEGDCSSGLLSRPMQDALRNLYQRLDAEVARFALACKACGRCCRFADYDHVLYLSRLEALCLFREGVPAASDDKACPFLSGECCGARARRPLGCRTFFCDKRHRDALQTVYEVFHREIKALSNRFGLEWRYAPLAEHVAAARQNVVPSEQQ